MQQHDNQTICTSPTITQQYSSWYRKASNSKNNHKKETSSEETYQQIMQIVNKLSDIFNHRMNIHESQLLTVMKMELHRTLEDLHDAIKFYNIATHKKNTNQDLWELQNQRDYFRHQAIKYFQQNRQLTKQQHQMKQQIRVLKQDILINKETMIKMGKKALKSQLNQNLSIHKLREQLKSPQYMHSHTFITQQHQNYKTIKKQAQYDTHDVTNVKTDKKPNSSQKSEQQQKTIRPKHHLRQATDYMIQRRKYLKSGKDNSYIQKSRTSNVRFIRHKTDITGLEQVYYD